MWRKLRPCRGASCAKSALPSATLARKLTGRAGPPCALWSRERGGMAWPKTIPSNGKEKKVKKTNACSRSGRRTASCWKRVVSPPGGMAPLPSLQCRARRAHRPPRRSCTASSPCNAGAVQTARCRRALDDAALLSPLCPMSNLGRLAAHMDGSPLFSRGGVCWTLPTTHSPATVPCDGVQSDACSLPLGRA